MTAALVITGASGFLGRAIVTAARAQELPVHAILRSDSPQEWANDSGITPVYCDLSGEDTSETLVNTCKGALAVIHAAAGSGGDTEHQRNTMAPTETLLAALEPDTRLVLISSFSVYGAAAVPDGATLDERTPTETDGVRRDAYTRAKLGQERLCAAAAQTKGLDLRVARPGAIYGPNRVWTARLGWRKGSRVVTLGGNAPIPAIHVESCATSIVRLAQADSTPWPSDLPMTDQGGKITWLNLLDANPPKQNAWLDTLGLKTIRLPLKPFLKAAAVMDLIADLSPWLDAKLPNGLREGTLAARFKPLEFSRARLEDRLGTVNADAVPFAQRLKEVLAAS